MDIKVNNGVAFIQSDDIIITDTQSALDLMATVRYEAGCDSIAISKTAVSEKFFDLSSGIAGEILQKFVNYRVRLAIIGDYSVYASKSLQDFIRESNKGSHIFFVENEDEAIMKLTY